jgi:hypothetical protein
MKNNHMRRNNRSNPISTAWLAFGALLAVGVAVLLIQEAPAMRRELKLMRM